MRVLLARARRLVGLALLACIGLDIVGDARCDSQVAVPGRDTIQRGLASSDDCQTVCIPDCFCCCRAINDPISASLFSNGPEVVCENALPDDQPDGVFQTIFHPPLFRA